MKNTNCGATLRNVILYLRNVMSVEFDWLRTGHVEGAILSCRMIILPSDVISALKSAGALVVTCFCFFISPSDVIIT